jgi:AmmeMemoRadiSam system protein B
VAQIWALPENGATPMQAHPEGSPIRLPAAAGLFYPRDPGRLRADVSDLLAGAPDLVELGPPKALIAPHAGYVYSGAVAAAAFATIGKGAEAISRVVLIGPSHFVALRGIAAPKGAGFATPLGIVPVDRASVSALADLPFVVQSDAPHGAPEHALEMELPFLQARLDDFVFVPLIVGEAGPQQVAAVLQRLWGGPETLIVVSSDLSHFHPYAAAQRRDAATAAAIEHGDWADLGPGDACGFLAIAGLLIEAGRRGLRARRLALCNSGDTAGSRDRVVGYGSWSLLPDAPTPAKADP